ncbi:hypothetical protein ISF_08672 [Cordyceps fumosorosea ARSEF 2679]|uniref:HAUS augmin-like complex subunit 3 N-terminal domain-containing protein n=1 Tax=Cordyceps fumosorosea (strain ARSEF 2679) TaxID=1081104 RepID=A0A167LZT2_CORFA|nr:hypothetical protein ISF_08672 [Cordyceps fumosorosea ARSEF 2679]OAA53733.1 hypothetical protein ISF_08672 [Cordyceps fumosorosea ARSEF 2679]
MATQAEAETLLIAAAASHGLAIAPHQIRAVLAEHGDPAAEELACWAVSNLSADNLLTVDELSLYAQTHPSLRPPPPRYNSLDASGRVDSLLAELQDDDTTSPLPLPASHHHEALVAVVQDLTRSTDALGKQAETLRHRRAACERLVANRAQAHATRRDLEASRRLKLDSERVRIESEVPSLPAPRLVLPLARTSARQVCLGVNLHQILDSHLTHGLEFRIAELTNNDRPSSLHTSLDPILRSDDALLASLHKLGWELSEPDPEEAKSTDKLRETCLRLIKITVETIRTRLDTTYLTTLAAAQQAPDYTTADPDDVDALQAELESLYAEVLPVAQMSVEQQHLEPALAGVAARTGRGLRKTTSSLAYADRCLDHLLSRANALHARAELHAAHTRSVHRVVAIARDEMASDVLQPTTRETPSPAKPPSRSKRLSRDLSHHRRRSSGVHDFPVALDTLMQSLALPVESYGDGSNSPSAQIASLARILRERRQKDAAASRVAQDELEALAGERLADARRAVQRLRESVLAETPFGSAPGSLADPGIEQSVDVLAQEVRKARDKLDSVDMGDVGWGSLKRDEFIERWAR